MAIPTRINLPGGIRQGGQPNQDKPGGTCQGGQLNLDKPRGTRQGGQHNQDKPGGTRQGGQPNQDTLALRGLEEPAHTSRGLEELLFQLCCCVSFWFWLEALTDGRTDGGTNLVICLAGARSLL